MNTPKAAPKKQVSPSVRTIDDNVDCEEGIQDDNSSQCSSLAYEPLKFVTMADAIKLIGGVTWLWQDWIPKGFLTIVAAHPGVGKSSFVLGSIVKSVIHGTPFIDGTKPEQMGKVIWCDTESTHGGNKDRVLRWEIAPSEIILPGEKELDGFKADNNDDVNRVRRLALENNVQLIVIDSFRNAHSEEENSSNIFKVMETLAALAQELNVAVLLIHHCRKNSDAAITSKPSLRGSSAIQAMARSVIILDVAGPDATDAIRIYVDKCNFSVRPKELAFNIVKDGIVPAKLPTKDLKLSRLEIARLFVHQYLSDGPKSSIAMQEAAKALEISDKTLDRARQDLGVECIKKSDAWYVRLPKTAEINLEGPSIAEDSQRSDSEFSDLLDDIGHLLEEERQEGQECQ